jgi:hypothetical protein
MINKLQRQYSSQDYFKTVGTKTNIHKVSYFFKEDRDVLHKKRILFIDLEFSMNKYIFELGGLVLNNGKVEEIIFKEYSLPKNEPYFSFEHNGFIDTPINKNKPLFSESKWLFNLLDSVDYIVVHNYPAEAQCFLKLLFPKAAYDIERLSIFNQNKIICTSYSFKNNYFKKLGLEKFSNSELSKTLGWSFTEKSSSYLITNLSLNMSFEIKKPANVVSKLHNSFFDILITFTNFISAQKIIEQESKLF